MNTRERLLKLHSLLLAAYGPQKWWPADSAFEVMVGAVLTQNTAWKNVEKAIANLKRAGLLDFEPLAALATEELAELIRPAGYYRIKAGRLKNLLATLADQYQGDLDYMFSQPTESLRQALLATKGVGPETADSILLYAGQKPVFVIDTYTFRILGRHGLADEEMDYHALQELITDSLDQDAALFNEFHALLVRLGNRRCKKSKPLCPGCPLEGF